MTFEHVMPGDWVHRMLVGTIPMKIRVSVITETKIITGGGWEFDRVTGAEIDELLGWGAPPLHTGSYLTHDDKTTKA